MSKKTLLLTLLAGCLWTAGLAEAETIPSGVAQKPFTGKMKPGDYIWVPEASPQGPVVIVVSLRAQVLYVYRNGVRIGRSTVSSGRPGRGTPTGVFTILEKHEVHHSSKYHNASMPFMERLTWGGVAIHAGGLPGYPESHGCIHVPLDFAKRLYSVTSAGTTVLVTNAAEVSPANADPGLLFSAVGDASSSTAASDAGPSGFTWKGQTAPLGPVSILVSSVERQTFVYRNGVEIARAKFGGSDALPPFGNHVYTALARTNPDGGHAWINVGGLDDSPAPDIGQLKTKLHLPPEFLTRVQQVVTEGTTLILTDQPVNETTRSGPGFKILNAAAPH